MDLIQINFPANIQVMELSNLLALLQTINAETQPAEWHQDPGALKDCWHTALDTAEKLRQVENSSIGHVMRERMEQYEKHPYSIPYDLEHNSGGQLIQAAIAVASNQPALVPTEWKDKGIMQKVFAKEAYGRLTVACALLIAHMDLIRIQNAQKTGAQVFINGVNSTELVDSMKGNEKISDTWRSDTYNSGEIKTNITYPMEDKERGQTLYKTKDFKGDLVVDTISIYSLNKASGVPLYIYDENGVQKSWHLDIEANKLNVYSVQYRVVGRFARVLLRGVQVAVAGTYLTCFTGCRGTLPNPYGYVKGWYDNKEIASKEGFGIVLEFYAVDKQK